MEATAIKTNTNISASASRFAIGSSILAIVALASLHILSPEFNPAWRVMSEYANGNYGWVLSIMFFAWAGGSLSLAVALKSQLNTIGKAGYVFLIVAGAGQFMAGIFDINHPLHNLTGLLGMPGLPIAAVLISNRLGKSADFSFANKKLRRAGHATWITLVLFIISFALLIVTYMNAGGDMSAGNSVKELPPGVIAVVGYANRLVLIVYCAWVITVARNILKQSNQ